VHKGKDCLRNAKQLQIIDWGEPSVTFALNAGTSKYLNVCVWSVTRDDTQSAYTTDLLQNNSTLLAHVSGAFIDSAE
jgi:hypothetical protein